MWFHVKVICADSFVSTWLNPCLCISQFIFEIEQLNLCILAEWRTLAVPVKSQCVQHISCNTTDYPSRRDTTIYQFCRKSILRQTGGANPHTLTLAGRCACCTVNAKWLASWCAACCRSKNRSGTGWWTSSAQSSWAVISTVSFGSHQTSRCLHSTCCLSC